MTGAWVGYPNIYSPHVRRLREAHNEYKSRRQTRDAQLEQSLWVSVWHISAATATNRLVELITETVKGGEVVGNV